MVIEPDDLDLLTINTLHWIGKPQTIHTHTNNDHIVIMVIIILLHSHTTSTTNDQYYVTNPSNYTYPIAYLNTDDDVFLENIVYAHYSV